MKSLSAKNLMILFSVLAVLLVAAHFLVFIFLRSSSVTVSALEHDIVLLEAQVSEFSKYNPDDLKSLAQSVTSHIISHIDFVSFISNIEKTARAQNVAIVVRSVTVEPRSEDPADDKEIMRLKLETTASWENTERYINYLEHLPYKINITNLGLSVLREEAKPGKAPVWRGQIEVTALKFK